MFFRACLYEIRDQKKTVNAVRVTLVRKKGRKKEIRAFTTDDGLASGRGPCLVTRNIVRPEQGGGKKRRGGSSGRLSSEAKRYSLRGGRKRRR